MNTNEKLNALRKLMKKNNINAYIIVTDDYHSSEYVGDFFKAREYMSGFTGSAGTLVVCENEACLWTDGRYFIQAENQLKDTTIKLMKSGQSDTPTIQEYLEKALEKNDTIAFDGRTVSKHFVGQLEDKLKIKYDTDLVNEIWHDRPEISKESLWELDIKYTGVSRKDKLKSVRSKMSEMGADVLILTALDEIAWLLNLRGNDVSSTPVFLSYMIITRDNATLFLHKEIVSKNIKNALSSDNVFLDDYDKFYDEIKKISKDNTVWIDVKTANYKAYKAVSEAENIITESSPIKLMKSVKNPTEISNIKNAHIKDGVAVTKFIYWIKNNIGKFKITELDACEKIESLRKEQEGYITQSFSPIIAYASHGAIVHYEPTSDTNVQLKAKGLLLCDTGGHYLEGTTDITRTLALGDLTSEEKRAYTLVLKGHLNLSKAKFVYGVCGENLDILARQPLWENGLDYNHSTGHGVGYLLSVHEGPQIINYNIKRNSHITLEEGMIFSNEPGYYLENKFGIRHENLVAVKKGKLVDNQQFMELENLTYVPFDTKAIEKSLLNSDEIKWLNEYHENVYKKISPYLDKDERLWLEKATKKI